MDRLEALIAELKQAIAHAQAAEAQRRSEAEAQHQGIQTLVKQLVSMHQECFWLDRAICAQSKSEQASDPARH
jgi:hypothetical protein